MQNCNVLNVMEMQHKNNREDEKYIDKVTVITVVYNDVSSLQMTIDSVLQQSWSNIEYIIIDGGSSDGTVDIIKGAENHLAYWCSEPDKGVYDAMNKGIKHATGDWICFLNSGDVFCEVNSIEQMMKTEHDGVDVLFANSIELSDVVNQKIEASNEINRMNYYPIYRHGSSLVRAEVHRRFLFDLSKSKTLGYSLDWEMIYRMFLAGCRFKKVNIYFEAYQKEGLSNHPYKNRWYSYLITSEGKFNFTKFLYFIYSCVMFFFTNSSLYKWVRAFFVEFMVNDILPLIPFWTIRRGYLKLMKAQIGVGSFMMKNVYIQSPNRLKIGEGSHINRGCVIDARGGITIGNSVSISHGVNIMTGGHDYKSPTFAGIFAPVCIEDYVWIGVGCTILQGVTIGKGAVICSGAVVTRDIHEYEVVAGVPAKKITTRPNKLNYSCHWDVPFT